MLGVYLASFTKTWSITDPSPMLALLFSTTLADMAEDYKSQLERCGKGDEYHIPMLRRPAPKGHYTKRRTINMDKFYADQETEDK